MKVFRSIMLFILNLLLIPVSMLLAAGVTWYSLPMMANSKIGI